MKLLYWKPVQPEDIHLCMSKALNDRKQKGKIFTIDILPNNKKNVLELYRGS